MRKLELSSKIWKDKNIKPEAKQIYAYLYSKGWDKTLINLNIGELQQTMKIKNVGLKNNLKILENNNYLKYMEYAVGMYSITIC